MKTIKDFVKSHPLVSYFVLAFVISWSGILIVAGGPGGIPVNSQPSEMLMPLLLLAMFAGPAVAGILLTGLVYGREGFRDLLTRMTRWRVGARWYAVALLTVPLLVTTVLLALSLRSPELLPSILTTSDKAAFLLSGIVAGLIAAIFEEIGWTGFAIPGPRVRLGHPAQIRGSGRERRKIMKHNVVRSVLTILLAAVAVFNIAEGILVLTRVRTPAVYYQGTLFADATIPMLLVAIVVGGSSLLAAVTVFTRHAWGVFLAAAAGLIIVAWELIQIVVVGQFSSIMVYIGVAVIALAEYLWTTEFSGQQLPPIKHEVIRIALLVVAAFIAMSAIEGGVAVVGGVDFGYKLPLSWLAGTPFSDYTIPGLALAIVVGGSALIAAATIFIHREWAVLVSVVAGVVMDGYLLVEIVSIDSKLEDALPTSLAVQLFYFVLGLALVGLGGLLWMREYRGQPFHLRSSA
jgi:membrane protease YdiL (CAAX protease family)